MRHRVTAILIAFVWGTIFGGDLLACGEKYIMPTVPTRFARPPAPRHDGAILIYANPSSELSRMVTKLSIAKALQDAGYRPTVAVDAAEFVSALRGQPWDLVIVDLADVRIAGAGEPNRLANGIIPVSYTLAGDQWSQARRQYPAILKAPSKARAFVDGIDAALEKQRATRTADKRR